MAFEFRLRVELKRAEDAFQDAKDRFAETYTARQTSYMITEGLYEMYQNVEKRGAGGYTRPEQYNSDSKAVETMWKQTVRTHEGCLRAHYNAEHAMKEAERKVCSLDKQLRDIEAGRERWIKNDETTGPWREDDLSEQYTIFYNPETNISFHFIKVFPPLQREKSKAAPPPRPPRSPPPSPGASRSPSPPPRRSEPPPKSTRRPPLNKPAPFPQNTAATVRPDQIRIENWFADVETALANPETLRSFPRPPQWICKKVSQGKCPEVALGLCKCCFASMFEGRDLKTWRTRFHPDKFSPCPENARADIEKVASEIFKWVNAYYKEQAEEKKRGRRKYSWED